MSHDRVVKGSTRREFAKAVALTAVVAPLAAAWPTEAASGVERVLPAPRRDPRQDEPRGDDPPETDALLEVVRLRYGQHLSAEQLDDVRSGIAGGLRAAERMKRVPPANGDEPAFVFAAYRREA